MNEDKALALVPLFLTIILMPFNLAWNGWVLLCLYSWFLQSCGLPPITLATAMGVILIVNVLQIKPRGDNDGDLWESFCRMIGTAFLAPAIYLGIGWIVKGVLQ